MQFNFAQLRFADVGPLDLEFLESDGYGTIIPFFWVDENSKLTPDSTGKSVFCSINLPEKSLNYLFADELKGLLNLPANLVLGLTIAFGFIGGLVMIGAGSFLIWRA